MAAALVPSIVLAVAASAAIASERPAHARWAAGQLLVRFNAGVGAADRAALVRAAGAQLEGELPLVPNLWEVGTAGRVSDAVGRLNVSRGVAYAQPDWIEDNQLDVGPDQSGYWPNDPYFWSARWGNPNQCEAGPGTQDSLAGWPFWPGVNLTDSQVPVQQFNPLAADQRTERVAGDPRFANYHSIDVLPVWNLLLDEGKLWNGQEGDLSRGVKRVGPWSRDDVERYGIGIIDTGISNSTDVARQLAAQFSVVGITETDANGPLLVSQITQTYSDGGARGDFALVRQALHNERNARLIEALRDPFVLDDTNELTPKRWSPTDENGQRLLPQGCDGHGTEVASVAGARANNRSGTAGVAYDAPLIGLRIGAPWDRRQVAYANNEHLNEARTAWNKWHQRAVETDSTLINQLAIVRALKLPVLNMSFGSPMLLQRPDAQNTQHLVVASPSLVEAYARAVSTGTTLGVTAAGNVGQRFGRAPAGQGADTTEGARRVTEPCGLPLIPKLGVWIQANPSVKDSPAARPYRPDDVNWTHLQLICVGATTWNESRLWDHSGRGDAAVDLTAPGVGITAAARPSAAHPDTAGAYVNVNGTSFAAPMVAGAASLLRRVAPDAPMSQIRLALERGARRADSLFGQVRYGHLDVACSLAWLAARRHEAESFLLHAKQIDPQGYHAFEQAAQGCQRSPYWSVARLTVPKAELFDAGEHGRSFPTMQALIDHLKLKSDPTSNSIRWQSSLLLGSGAEWNGGRAVFQMGRLFHPLAPPARQVFGMGFLTLGCRPGYTITRLRVAFDNIIKPNRAWVLPTDNFAPTRAIELAVAVAEPKYVALLGDRIKLSSEARCEYFGNAAG
ncbi:MAG: S8 family peptidase [Solirubrobacteraceae bacterium]